jgi:mono/diheme cytochrome c family protein
VAGGWWLVLKLRARQNKLARFGGMAGVGLLSTIFTIVAIAAALGFISLYAPRGNDVLDVTVAGTAEQVARGEVIAAAMCASCHSLHKELPLSGNTNLLEEIPMPLGIATPPNLTPAGRIADWTDGELQRVIREGTYPNGHRAAVMSSQNFRVFSQDDLDSIVAYLRSTPAVTSDIEPKQGLNVLAFAFITLGMLPLKDQPDSNIAPPAIPKGPTVAYGKYVATFADCTACHGETLEGGAGGLLPKGPSLRGVIGWQSEGFTTAMRTGVTPGGKELSDKMPWEAFKHFDDESLHALYEYITSL